MFDWSLSNSEIWESLRKTDKSGGPRPPAAHFVKLKLSGWSKAT